MNKLIKGLNHFHNDMNGIGIYFTNKMIKQGILIEENTFYNEHQEEIQTVIKVKALNSFDAHEFLFYWDKELAPIQIYRIIKDIYEMYTGYNLIEFLDFISDVCTEWSPSSSQGNKDNRDRIIDSVSESFVDILIEIYAEMDGFYYEGVDMHEIVRMITQDDETYSNVGNALLSLEKVKETKVEMIVNTEEQLNRFSHLIDIE